MTKLNLKSSQIKVNEINNKTKIKKDASLSNVNKFYATGKKKCAIARVWLKPGKGSITVNKQNGTSYFFDDTHIKSIFQPFEVTNTNGQYDIVCTVKGGGVKGQVDAVLYGVAKALNTISLEFHSALRKNGFLTRDSRVVERKKYGQHGARKKTQFSKR